MEEEQEEVGQWDVWIYGEGIKKKEEVGIGASGRMNDGRVEESGVQGVLQIYWSPRDSLVFARRRLVINRL